MRKKTKPLELALLDAAATMIDRAIEHHLADSKKSILHCGDVERLLGVIHHLKRIMIRLEGIDA
jgi:hypothetical protein